MCIRDRVEDVEQKLFLFLAGVTACNERHAFHLADGGVGDEAEHGHLLVCHVAVSYTHLCPKPSMRLMPVSFLNVSNTAGFNASPAMVQYCNEERSYFVRSS